MGMHPTESIVGVMEQAMEEYNAELPKDLDNKQNAESYLVERSQDDLRHSRAVYQIGRCLCQNECSEASWSKHQPWSLESPTKCLEYLKYHLVRSGNHNKTDAEAQDLIQDAWAQDEIVWCSYEDPYETREAYRKNIEAIEKKKASQPKVLPQPKAKKRKTGEASSSAAGLLVPLSADDDGDEKGQAAAESLQVTVQKAVNVALMQTQASPNTNLHFEVLQFDRQQTLAQRPGTIAVQRDTLRAAVHLLQTSENSLQSCVIALAHAAKELAAHKDLMSNVKRQVQNCLDAQNI